MTALAFLSIPMLTVERGPFGVGMAESEGHINGWPVAIVITHCEVFIEFKDRDGPAFVIDLNAVAKAALNEIEAKLGVKKRMLG